MRFSDQLTQTVLRRPVELGQYTSWAFGRRCEAAGVRPSMGSVGDASDNALCESFFATLECELLDRQRFATQVQARLAVFDFIEGLVQPAPSALRPRLRVTDALGTQAGLRGGVTPKARTRPRNRGKSNHQHIHHADG